MWAIVNTWQYVGAAQFGVQKEAKEFHFQTSILRIRTYSYDRLNTIFFLDFLWCIVTRLIIFSSAISNFHSFSKILLLKGFLEVLKFSAQLCKLQHISVRLAGLFYVFFLFSAWRFFRVWVLWFSSIQKIQSMVGKGDAFLLLVYNFMPVQIAYQA